MRNEAASILHRSDTLLGVCQAIGEDVGFNPLWLRLALGVTVLFNLEAAVLAYLVMGVVVLASRLIVRAPSRDVAVSVPVAAVAEASEPAEVVPAVEPARPEPVLLVAA